MRADPVNPISPNRAGDVEFRHPGRDEAEAVANPTDTESLVTDGRALIRPAQVVEGRVVAMLQRLPTLVSQFERSARPRFR